MGTAPVGEHEVPSLVKEGIYSSDSKEKQTYKHYNEMMAEMEQLELQSASFREAAELNINKAVERLQAFDKVSCASCTNNKDLISYVLTISGAREAHR